MHWLLHVPAPLSLTKPCISSVKYTGTFFFLTNHINYHSEFSRDGRQPDIRRYSNLLCDGLQAFYFTVLQLILGSFSLHLKKALEIFFFPLLTRFTRNKHFVYLALKFYRQVKGADGKWSAAFVR